uniref:Uncharacterized protein n=1 Tax=Anguilla anguilla TaxID=7936 RepID=A0A0E9UAM6_ANGAN
MDSSHIKDQWVSSLGFSHCFQLWRLHLESEANNIRQTRGLTLAGNTTNL